MRCQVDRIGVDYGVRDRTADGQVNHGSRQDDQDKGEQDEKGSFAVGVGSGGYRLQP